MHNGWLPKPALSSSNTAKTMDAPVTAIVAYDTQFYEHLPRNAARSLGFDVGAMSGFDNAKVDEAFFPDGRFKSNFLCNIGFGDHSKLFNRGPRLSFEEVCTLA